MTILTYASIVYVAILVLALAVVLITIWVLLLRISGVLGRVQKQLGQVARHTQPLGGQLGALTTAAVTAADEVSRGVSRFRVAAERHLPLTTERRR